MQVQSLNARLARIFPQCCKQSRGHTGAAPSRAHIQSYYLDDALALEAELGKAMVIGDIGGSSDKGTIGTGSEKCPVGMIQVYLLEVGQFSLSQLGVRGGV